MKTKIVLIVALIAATVVGVYRIELGIRMSSFCPFFFKSTAQ